MIAHLRDLGQHLDHLRITHTTLLAVVGEPDPASPPPQAAIAPDHPAYQQILTPMADIGPLSRARDLYLALARKNIENTRAKLKCLASLDILVEIEPGLLAKPLP